MTQQNGPGISEEQLGRSTTQSSLRLTPIITPRSSPTSMLQAGFPVTSAAIKPVAVRKRSIDDSHLNTAGSPLRTSYFTPSTLHESGGLSENSALRTSEDAALLFRNSSCRKSIGSELRLSRARMSVGKASPSLSFSDTGRVTKAQTVFDDFDILKDASATEEEKTEARERLTHVFSMEKGQPYIEDCVKKLEDQYHRLTFELNLATVTRGIIANVISDKILFLEYSWQQFVVEVVEKAITKIDGRYRCVGGGILADAITEILSEKTDPELSSFLRYKYAHLHLVLNLSAKTIAKLQEIIAGVKALYLMPQRLFSSCAVEIVKAVIVLEETVKAKKIYKIIDTIYPKKAGDYIRTLQGFSVPLLSTDEGTKVQDALTHAFQFQVSAKLESEIIVDQIAIKKEALAALQKSYEENSDGPIEISVVEYAEARIHFACKEHFSSKTNTLASADTSLLSAYEERSAALEKSINDPTVIETAKKASETLYYQLKEHPQLMADTLNTYPRKTIKDLEEHNQLHEAIEESVRGAIDSVSEQLQECLAYQKEIQGKISKQTGKDAPAIVTERVSVLDVDSDGKTPLDHALECKNFELIAIILANAKASNVLVQLLHTTLLKINKEDFKTLIAGAYLFDPEDGGLYNPTLVAQVRACSPVIKSDDTDFASRFGNYSSAATPSVTPTRGSSESRPIFDSMSGFFNPSHQPILTEAEQVAINEQVLQEANDKTLASFIRHVEDRDWRHPVSYQASEIRTELKRLIANSKPISTDVKKVLNKNLAIAERGDRLATFYDKETRHVCEVYSKDPGLYGNKARMILTELKTSAVDNLDELEQEAIRIANNFVGPMSKMGERRAGGLPDPHLISKTQRLFYDARRMLPDAGAFAPLQRGWCYLTNALTGSGYQHDSSVLTTTGSIATVDAGLTDALIDKIPLTAQEKEACVKRAALARGVFKSTLEYLERRPNPDKLTAVKTHIQGYVNGALTAADLIGRLETAKDTTLKSKEWYGLWAKSERLMNQDLRNANAFQELDKRTVAAAAG